MELEIYSAFVSAGVTPEKAKEAVDSISREIDKRYALHSQQLATRGDAEIVRKEVSELRSATKADIAEAKFEIIKWTVTSVIASVGLFATVTKLWHS